MFATLHLHDLAAAYLAALTDSSASGRYNLVGQAVAMRDLATAMSHGVGGGGSTSALTLDEAVERWGALGRGLLGGPMVSSVRATAELGWSPSGPSLAYELIHGTLRAA